MNFTEISYFVIRFPSPSRKAGMTASEFDNKVDTPNLIEGYCEDPASLSWRQSVP